MTTPTDPTGAPTREELREALAEYAHSAWSGWMDYLFSKCTQHPGKVYRIPPWAVERWERQTNTPYAELPEDEKESDRAEADKMLALLGAALDAAEAEAKKYKEENELMRAALQGFVDSWEAGVDFDSRTLRPYVRGMRRILGGTNHGD